MENGMFWSDIGLGFVTVKQEIWSFVAVLIKPVVAEGLVRKELYRFFAEDY